MKKGIILLLSTLMFSMTGACSEEDNDIKSLLNENDTTLVADTAAVNDSANTPNNPITYNSMNLQIGNKTLTATLADNSSVDALVEALKEAPITIDMSDYGNMEKVGSFGQSFPRNDEQITTEAGDLILYQGSAFVIYYAPNSWDFTRLGKIDNITASELKAILGDGDVTVTLSLP